MSDTTPDEPAGLRCNLENVTEGRLRRSIGVRFVIFLVQGKIFNLVADGEAAHAGAITRDQSKVPFGSNKLAYGWMKIKRDGTFEVKTHAYPEIPDIPLPDMRTPLLNTLKNMGIEIK